MVFIARYDIYINNNNVNTIFYKHLSMLKNKTSQLPRNYNINCIFYVSFNMDTTPALILT